MLAGIQHQFRAYELVTCTTLIQVELLVFSYIWQTVENVLTIKLYYLTKK